MSYQEWRKALFQEVGEDEDLFVAAGEDYIHNMYVGELDVVSAADELIDVFAID